MKTFKMKSLATAAAVAALGLGFASSAHALQYNVTLYDINNTANFQNWVVTDDTTGGANDGDTNAAAGIIDLSLGDLTAPLGFLTAGGGYVVVGSQATNIGGAPGSAYLRTTSTSVTNNTGSSIRAFVVVTDNNLQGPKDYVVDTGSVTFASGTSTTLTNSFYNNPNNNISGLGAIANYASFQTFLTNLGTSTGAGNLLNTMTLTTAPSDSENYASFFTPADTGPFAMSLVFDFTLDNGERLETRTMWMEKSSQQVPEPMTMSLLGAGLVGLGAARRRKAKAKAKLAEAQA